MTVIAVIIRAPIVRVARAKGPFQPESDDRAARHPDFIAAGDHVDVILTLTIQPETKDGTKAGPERRQPDRPAALMMSW